MIRLLTSGVVVTGVLGLAWSNSLHASAQNPFPESFTIEDIVGIGGYQITGTQAFGRVGTEVAGLGDINGDGFADFALSSVTVSSPNGPAAGRTYIVFGSSTLESGPATVGDINGLNGFYADGEQAFDSLGTPAALGDFNLDGIDDFALGAYGHNNMTGRAYVVYGSPNLGSSGVMDLASLGATAGTKIDGIDAGDDAGASISAGDVNGDGKIDLIIGAEERSRVGNERDGSAFIVFGKGAQGLGPQFNLAAVNAGDGAAGIELKGDEDVSWYVKSVRSGFDLNGDGYDEVLIGGVGTSFRNARVGIPAVGFVFYGGADVGSAGPLWLDDFDGTDGFRTHGGHNIEGLGDINGDGIDDYATGFSLTPDSFVRFGEPGIGSDGAVDFDEIDGNGFLVSTSEQQSREIDRVGDLNADGYDDFATQFIYYEDLTPKYAMVIAYGGPGIGESGAVDISLDFGPNEGFVITSDIQMSAGFGGDINGDGIDDMLVYAREYDTAEAEKAGAVFVVYGRPVPEPATLAGVFCWAGMLAFRRRRA